MDYTKIVIGGVIALVVLLLLFSGYVKAPPNQAYIISGIRKEARRIIGRAAIRIPFFERLDILPLAAKQVDVKTSQPVPTADYINVRVDSVVNIKIPNENESMTIQLKKSDGKIEERIYTAEEMLSKAQQNFLNKQEAQIISVAKEVLEGNVREIIGQMSLEEMVSDRQRFAELVKQNASPDLAELGLMIVSFNVQNFIDDAGVIENLGIDNTERIRKNAAIAKANAKKDVAVAESQAQKQANDAKVEAELEIARKQTELAIKQAELKTLADIEKAKAEAAFSIQAEEQRKIKEITTANANIAKQEKEIELKLKEAEVMDKTLDANVRRVAEADKYKAEQEADASLYTQQKITDAKKYQDEKNSEAELAVMKNKSEAELVKAQKQAEAEKAMAEAAKFVALQQAEGIRAKGLAEAEAIRAKALAEAEGLEKKAEAMQKMQEAAVLQMYFDKLPEVAKAIAQPLTNVKNITMYGEGNSSKLVGDITKSISQVNDGLLAGTGMSVSDLFSGIMTGKMVGNTVGNKVAEAIENSNQSDKKIEFEL